jgi:hypothetical protein
MTNRSGKVRLVRIFAEALGDVLTSPHRGVKVNGRAQADSGRRGDDVRVSAVTDRVGE